MNDLKNWVSPQQQDHRRKLAAWSLAHPVLNYDPNKYRRDAYGSWIAWSEYGKHTPYGWEIDHELPKAHFPNMANHPANQRALHWRNNRIKSDKLDFETLRRLLGGV